MNDTASEKTFNVLFLCTGNSARSIMAEAIVDRLGQGRFAGYSAGSHPTGEINPHALALLERRGHRTRELRSKSWDEFAVDGAPRMDFVFTVCDNAAEEVCPAWPGRPVTAHWGFPDPAAVRGSNTEIRAAFADIYRELVTRVDNFVNLPVGSIDRTALELRVRDLGKSGKTGA